jgi:cellulose synthase operon protein C
MCRPVFILALLLSGPALGQSADVVEAVPPEEVEAFRKARDRFAVRMRELDDDTLAFVDLREGEEREKLIGGYDALLEDLEGVSENRRVLAIERFQSFLERYPDAAYGSHVRFRLADLLFEDSRDVFFAESDAYFEALNSDDLELLESLVEPKMDLAGPIALYEKIVADNTPLPPEQQYERLDGAFLMLGFCYNDSNSLQRDQARAMRTFQQLVDELPESQLADRSHLFLGNNLFEEGDFDAAVAEYNEVFARGSDGPYYSEAMYQLAWAHYKESRYDEAMDLFVRLLDESAKEKVDRGKESPFAPDAIQYMAYSIQDIALLDDDRNSVRVAEDHFRKVGERDYEWEIYAELADVLIRYTRQDEAVEVYRKLQDDPRWRNHPRNPEWQIAIVNLYGSGLIQDLVKSGEERLKLTKRYNDGGEWWIANRNNPDALAKARGFIESSLLDVAIEYYVRADESNNPEDFVIAATKFQEYLDKFPIADDYYDQQWLLANAYQRGNMLSDAEREYARLLKSARYHGFLDGAVWKLLEVRNQLMQDLSGPPDVTPEQGKVLRKDNPTDGVEILVLALSDDRANFVEAADAVVTHEFSTPDPTLNLPDFKGRAEEKRTALMYIPAQLMFYHRQYPEARERLEAILDYDYYSLDADYAASLILNTWLEEGNLKKARDTAKRFTVNPPGPPSDVPDDKYLNTLEGTSFKLALELAQANLNIEAAEAFLAFRNEFPQSEYAADALHNGAFYFQVEGKKERANELYEEFVNAYPEDERSERLYFRIAGNYEATFDFDRAIDFYDRLVKKFPDGDNAESATYNASYLRIGLRDHLGAAKGFETYARKFEEAEDREEVHWLAGEQYEQVDDGKALSFYKKYLKQYGTESPEHAIEATHRIAEIYLRQGNNRAHERQLDAIIDIFDEIAESGTEIGAAGHKYAARSEFRSIAELYEKVVEEQLSGDEEKDAALLNDIKPPEIKEFENHTKAFAAKYANFEYTTAALYYQGMAVLYLGDLGLSVQCPEGYTEEECWAYEDILMEVLFPQYEAVVDVGIKKLTELVDAAVKQKQHSEWIDKAYEELNRRRPLEYPALKEEFLGEPDPRIPTAINAQRMEAPEVPEDEEGAEDSPVEDAGSGEEP